MSSESESFTLNNIDFDSQDLAVFDLVGISSVRTVATYGDIEGQFRISIFMTYNDGRVEEQHTTGNHTGIDHPHPLAIAAQDACYQVVNQMLAYGRLALMIRASASNTLVKEELSTMGISAL